ncbi:hypothetical protein ASPNIDRAFT_123216, partial [Aspergillus niger ATCC 1015]
VPDYEKAGCQFAIRSGGHNSFGGASNIHNGVTIDLRALNTIQVQEAPTENDEDESAQNKEAQHTVFVGAGATWGEVYALLDPLGLSVAGGRAAQVGVGGLTLGGGISYFSPRYGWTCDNLVGAEVVLANGTIVYLDEGQHSDWLAALRGGGANFGVGPIYGGSIYHSTETIDAQLRAFAELADPKASSYDEYASLITSFGFAGGQGAAIVNSVVYTGGLEEPGDDGITPPPAVYKALFDIPQLFSTMRRSLVVTLLSATWDDAADDARVEEAAKDSIASYGPESIERLRRISREVDPTGVFQNMVPGGFKIQQ